ncbi:GAF domain-containing protein [Bradyrhizobium sp. LB7.2]
MERASHDFSTADPVPPVSRAWQHFRVRLHVAMTDELSPQLRCAAEVCCVETHGRDGHYENSRMRRGNGTQELKLVAKAFQIISREISYQGLAKALLAEALSYSGATRGAILLSGQRELLAKADASFPRERTNFLASFPPNAEFSLPNDLAEVVLDRKETVVRHAGAARSALVDPTKPSCGKIAQLCLPLVHQDWAIGVLYLESDGDQDVFTPQCVWVISMLATQAAISFESVRALRGAARDQHVDGQRPADRRDG